MTRRSAFKALNAGPALATAARTLPAASTGRLKQSVARWCFSKIALEDLCRACADMGLAGLDLINPQDWPTLKKFGLVPAMVSGAASIADGWNRKESHDRLEKEMLANIARAAEAKLPNVITFSGNRRGLSDEEGKANCILGLQRVKKAPEERRALPAFSGWWVGRAGGWTGVCRRQPRIPVVSGAGASVTRRLAGRDLPKSNPPPRWLPANRR